MHQSSKSCLLHSNNAIDGVPGLARGVSRYYVFMISSLSAMFTEYLTALASSVAFKDRKMWACMRVLHTDIVAVWNFRDPHDVIFIFALITFILT